MPKIAEILECKKQSVARIFGWIGAEDKDLAEVKEKCDPNFIAKDLLHASKEITSI